jgi:hypothetical protein
MNAFIEVGVDGARARNRFRKIIFQAKWSEVQRVSKRTSYLNSAEVFEVYARAKKMTFDTHLPSYDRLIKQFRKNCPNVDFMPWRGA